MKTLRYVFPGRFCPPTFGHYNVVKRSAQMFPHVTVVCSTNPDKTQDIFLPHESKELWQSYKLPSNVTVLSFEEFRKVSTGDQETVIVRGIRNYEDLRDEERVMALNKKLFGIDKYFYLVGDDDLKQVSASKARELAMSLRFEELAGYIAPLIISKLFERTLGIDNLFLVVGRPGSGKSTFLKMLSEIDGKNVHINTDQFNKKVRPLLLNAFGQQDLIRLSIEKKEEFASVIKGPWFDLLREAMISLKKMSNVFVEIPYGLQLDKAMYNFVGGKVVYIGCGNETENRQRIVERGKPEIAAFINEIPDWQASLQIANENQLQICKIDTSGSLEKLQLTAEKFNQEICPGVKNV